MLELVTLTVAVAVVIVEGIAGTVLGVGLAWMAVHTDDPEIVPDRGFRFACAMLGLLLYAASIRGIVSLIALGATFG